MPEIGLVQGPGKNRLRIALYTDTPYGTPCHPESSDLVNSIGALCEKLGHAVCKTPCPCKAEMADDFIIYWGMIAFFIRFFGPIIITPGFDRSGLEDWTIKLSGHFQKNFFKIPATIKRLISFTETYNNIFETFDILLNPTLSHPTPEIWLYGSGSILCGCV